MDISSLYSETTTLEIMHPKTGEPLGITVELYSMDSDAVKSVQRKWQNRTLKAKGEGFTASDIDAQAIETMCAAIATWDWADGLEWQGETPNDSYAFKKRVLSSSAGGFILRQIDKAMADETRFFGNAAKA